MQVLSTIFFISLFGCVISFDHGGISYSPYILESESLPDNLNFMPTLGNGHLGFTMFGDSILVNGVYNGKQGLSHRARIQNVGNISVIPIGSGGYTKESYKLDLYNGIFERKQSNSEIVTIVRTYPHRFFNRAIINEIFVLRRENTTEASHRPLKLHVEVQPGSHSDDFTPLPFGRLVDKTVVFCQQTKEVENAEFQSFNPYVCLAMNIWPEYVELPSNQSSLHMRIVVVLGETSVKAVKELNDGMQTCEVTMQNFKTNCYKTVLAKSNESLFEMHCEQWNSFWKQFHIDLDGNLELSRIINAGIFYIGSSLPSPLTNQQTAPYFGLSPTGLGRGYLEDDYQGHNFWDTEIWMLPAVTQLSTNWTRDLLDYRFRMLKAAVDHANQTGFDGARFPWESAMTGTEVTNPCCPEVALYQFHITADIAFAVRHYLAVTNDTQWMEQKGCELSRRIAEFWVSRVSWDSSTHKYDIKGVMGPDEDHENVTNNAYTNIVVRHALEFINLTQSVCGTEANFVSECLKIAEKIKIPYDAKLDYNPQYDGYTPNTTIKQADAVLLSYPLLFPMNTSTISNNLRIYEKVTRPTGPAMTWSMYAIGHLDEGNPQKADELFEKGYKDYVREPFKVWSEVIIGKVGAANFLTGVGGFLQAIINGYGGIRFHSNCMEIRKPSILPGTKSSVISGIKYQGLTFTIKLSTKPVVVVDSIMPGQVVHLVHKRGKELFMEKEIEYLIREGVEVRVYRSG